MDNKKLIHTKLNALLLEVDSSIVNDIRKTVYDIFADEERYVAELKAAWIMDIQSHLDIIKGLKETIDELKARLDTPEADEDFDNIAEAVAIGMGYCSPHGNTNIQTSCFVLGAKWHRGLTKPV